MRRMAVAMALALAACSPAKPEAPTPPAPAAEPAPAKAVLPPVEPPEPGTPGGLPDDRTPIPEAPPAPDSGQAAARVLERYYSLLETGQPAEAAKLRRDAADERAGWSEVRTHIGTPGAVEGAAGSLYVEIPVSYFGRDTSGAAIARAGKATLRRVNGVPGAMPEQLAWHIEKVELGPTVSLKGP